MMLLWDGVIYNPVNMKPRPLMSPGDDLTLGQSRGRQANIKPALGEGMCLQ